MSKKKRDEIKVIADSLKRRPYASKIDVVLGESLYFTFDGEAALLTDQNYIVTIKPQKEEKENGRIVQRFTVTVEGFATASQAENTGLKLSMALLWTSVSRKWPLKLEYHTPQPCMVFDRTKSYRSFGSSGTMLNGEKADTLSRLIDQILSKDIKEVDPKILISMELFASSKFESTERAKFIGLVSSLEPLAESQPYEIEQIENLTDDFIDKIKKIDNLPANIKNSVIGRAVSLKKESISQAIISLINRYFPGNQKVIDLVKEAYNIRSGILHEGSFDADLDEKSNVLEDIIRHIYSNMFEIELLFPIEKLV